MRDGLGKRIAASRGRLAFRPPQVVFPPPVLSPRRLTLPGMKSLSSAPPSCAPRAMSTHIKLSTAALAAAALSAAACADDPMRPAADAAPLRPHAAIIGLKPVVVMTITDLGTLSAGPAGSNSSVAYGINDSGVVTGPTTMTGKA